MPSKSVLDLMRERGLLSQDFVTQAQTIVVSQKVLPEDALLSLSGVDAEAVARVAGEVYAMPYMDLTTRKVPFEILNKFPEDIARKYNMVVFETTGDSMIKVAVSKPWDPVTRKALDFIRNKNNVTIDPYITSQKGIVAILDQYANPVLVMKDTGAPKVEPVKEAGEVKAPTLQDTKETPVKIDTLKTEKEAKPVVSDLAENDLANLVQEEVTSKEQLQDLMNSSAIPRIVAAIIKFAVTSKTSDIHVEPNSEADTRVRFRVDGVLQTIATFPGRDHAAFVSRVKILAKLKIDEQRVPQDGRIDVTFGDREIDLRISTFPTINGEKVVMRILDKGGGIIQMEQLGLTGKSFDYLMSAIQIPHGVLLVTGPTGSGKSTTLYAIIGRLNKEGVNIVTLEDPVEYQINGIAQSQVKPYIGYTFAQGLRSILRQDPNIIMVGEIRDKETAEMAVQSALTGHLVLSTLHTNDAAGAIPRLIDMGIEPFLIASSLHTIIAQRLVRKVCQNCKKVFELPATVLEDMKREYEKVPEEYKKDIPFDLQTVVKGEGCKVCSMSGYKGRIGIYELLPVSEAIQKLLIARASANDILHQALSEGMITMKQDGILKVLKGVTTMEEVYRVTNT
ncbi:MAG: GspE/PulE family protein [Patescibacteria group bacterium]